MLDFRPPVTEDRKWVAPIISHAKRFGCDYSFGDMFIWQHVYNIRIASHDGFLFSINGTDDDNGVKRPTYGFPVGEGDLKAAIELIEEDSAKRGSGCILSCCGIDKSVQSCPIDCRKTHRTRFTRRVDDATRQIKCV